MFLGVRQVVKAFIFITVEPGNVKEVLERVKTQAAVQRAYALTGPYDIIAEVKGESIEEIGKSVVHFIQSIPGVQRTLTSLVVEI